MKRVEKIFHAVCKKYDIHNRQFTKEDFFRICEGENIALGKNEVFRPFSERARRLLGVYVRVRGSEDAYIYLKCIFGKRFDRHTAFHELGHHFCAHLVGLKSEEGGIIQVTKKEAEADHFAFLATGLKRRRKRLN